MEPCREQCWAANEVCHATCWENNDRENPQYNPLKHELCHTQCTAMTYQCIADNCCDQPNVDPCIACGNACHDRLVVCWDTMQNDCGDDEECKEYRTEQCLKGGEHCYALCNDTSCRPGM